MDTHLEMSHSSVQLEAATSVQNAPVVERNEVSFQLPPLFLHKTKEQYVYSASRHKALIADDKLGFSLDKKAIQPVAHRRYQTQVWETARSLVYYIQISLHQGVWSKESLLSLWT